MKERSVAVLNSVLKVRRQDQAFAVVVEVPHREDSRAPHTLKADVLRCAPPHETTAPHRRNWCLVP